MGNHNSRHKPTTLRTIKLCNTSGGTGHGMIHVASPSTDQLMLTRRTHFLSLLMKQPQTILLYPMSRGYTNEQISWIINEVIQIRAIKTFCIFWPYHPLLETYNNNIQKKLKALTGIAEVLINSSNILEWLYNAKKWVYSTYSQCNILQSLKW